MRIEIQNAAAVICRHYQTGKWIICWEFGDFIEGDDMASRRGQFRTRKSAIEAFRKAVDAA